MAEVNGMTLKDFAITELDVLLAGVWLVAALASRK